MKRRMIHSWLILSLIVSSAAASSFACLTPCHMTQAQMLKCAASCSSAKADGHASLSARNCTHLNVSAQAQYLTAAEFKLKASGSPAILLQAAAAEPANVQGSVLLNRGPPVLINSTLNRSARQNAPPTLI